MGKVFSGQRPGISAFGEEEPHAAIAALVTATLPRRIQPRTTQHLNMIAHKQLGLMTFDYHTLRHSHATMLLEAGVNPVDIQEWLGHSKLTMTWRYAHNTDAIRKESEAIMDRIFSCP